MATMTAVPVMHEKMHQRASEKEQKRQHAQDMRRMLGHEVKAGDNKKAEQNDATFGAP
jgi:phage regulator Rha-like protein